MSMSIRSESAPGVVNRDNNDDSDSDSDSKSKSNINSNIDS